MDRLLQDVRYALRSFAKTPGFTIVVLMTLGIGIGVNSTVFGFVNALLLRPAPGLRDAGRVVSVFTSDFSSGLYGSSSYPDYESIKTATTAFEALAAFNEGGVTLVRLGRGATDRYRRAARGRRNRHDRDLHTCRSRAAHQSDCSAARGLMPASLRPGAAG